MKKIYFILKENGDSYYMKSCGLETDGVAFFSLEDLLYRWEQYIAFVTKKLSSHNLKIKESVFDKADPRKCVFEFSYEIEQFDGTRREIECGFYVKENYLYDNLEEYKESPSNQENND